MEDALIICRFIHFATAMLLFGAGSFTGLLAPSGLGTSLQRRFARTEVVLAVILIVSAVAWLGLQAGEIGDGWTDVTNPDAISAVLTGTAFGSVWMVRLGLVLLPAVALLLREQRQAFSVALASGVALASLAFVGHAADEEGALGLMHRFNHALHLLSGGFWLGCLPPLLVVLGLLRNPELRADAVTALRHFSGFGHLAVALVLVSGLLNTLLVVHALPTDISSPYQVMLDVKIALVCLMVAIAVVNRYVAVPRLSHGGWALRGIVAGTVAEIAIGAVVVGLVSAFATFDPTPGGS